MRDFTLTIYKKYLTALTKANYKFVTFEDYVQDSDKNARAVILRHDVDKKPLHSLWTAELENELGIKGTYYFRVIKNELPKEVIERIAKLGHEIGYHYDDLNGGRGDLQKALDSFQKNLDKLRQLAPIKTACMHGSPMSKHDNHEMWRERNYKEFGIIGEPYLDIDFNKVMYLTDTGRRWDGDKVSIRDRVGEIASSQKSVVSSKKKEVFKNNKMHSTMDIINALEKNHLPSKIMLTIHPQRWTDNYFHWLQELLWQKFKNLIKYIKLKRMEKNSIK